MPSHATFTAHSLPPTWRRKHLSPAEQQVVALVARGLSDKSVAAELEKSTVTVSNQLQRAMRKLGLRSRYEVIAAVREDIAPALAPESVSYVI